MIVRLVHTDKVIASERVADQVSGAKTATYWILRVGAAACFVGHGAFGFITKAAWVPYFSLAGIPESWAWRLMPLVGAVDILVGMAVLFAPRALPLVYMSVWALGTALLRPLSGESVFEALERAGNYGVPFALLILVGVRRSWEAPLKRVEAVPPDEDVLPGAWRWLQCTTVLLLLGHGGLAVTAGNPIVAGHYAAIGLPAGAAAMSGWFEIGLATAVALRPSPGLLLLVAAWKLATESLFIVAGAPIWEFVERAGSYAAPLALGVLLAERRPFRRTVRAALGS